MTTRILIVDDEEIVIRSCQRILGDGSFQVDSLMDGHEAMRRIEEFVRAQGGSTIGLSVFGFNKVAQNLYRSEGYDVTRLSMQKRLG